MFRCLLALCLSAAVAGYGNKDRDSSRGQPQHWTPSGAQTDSTDLLGDGNLAQPIGGSLQDGNQEQLGERLGGRLKGDTSRTNLVFAWELLTYNFDGESEYVPNGGAASEGPGDESTFFIPYSNIPVGLDRWKDKLFLTIPRRGFGVPATVVYVSLKKDGRSPGVRPYPNLSANTYVGNNVKGPEAPLVSVYRPRVDSCNRLWLLDTGLIEAYGGTRQVQRPAIVIYDLNTDRRIRRFELPDSVIKNGVTSGFISITVDTEDRDCNNAHAYIPDIFEAGLVIYSLRQNRAWRMTHAYFSLDPQQADFNVNGLQYQWRDGIFSVVLSTRYVQGRRMTYALFHPMATLKEFSVPTEVLKNETLATRRFHFNDLKVLGERGQKGQSAVHGIHPATGVVFYTQVHKNGIACWNTHKPLNPNNVQLLAQDDELLFYPADLKVDQENEVWFLTNKFPAYFFSSLDKGRPNLRVFRMNVKNAIEGTVCDV